MEEHELLIVKWVNDMAGGLMIPAHVVMQTIILLICIVFFGVLRMRLSVESPGSIQQAFEVFVEFLEEQLESNVGHEGHKYLGIIGTFFVFIVFSNLIGLIPGLESPTGIRNGGINVTAGCAVIVFLF